jgi:pyrroline-5-carboxylate reductase
MAFERIAVIGAGVIGEALINLLIKSGIAPNQIYVAEKRAERASEICDTYSLSELRDSDEINRFFIAVKPQDFEVTLSSLAQRTSGNTLVVSFAAGIKIEKIERLLGSDVRVIRVMPNTPMTVGRGMSAMSPGKYATTQDQQWLMSLLSISGSAISVSEELQDAVTATSGSGPAYFFAFTEAIEAAAQRLGLDATQARMLARETLIGSALMVDKTGKELQILQENVTSPNGTTAAALASFKSAGLDEVIYEAMKAARDRSIELSS